MHSRSLFAFGNTNKTPLPLSVFMTKPFLFIQMHGDNGNGLWVTDLTSVSINKVLSDF